MAPPNDSTVLLDLRTLGFSALSRTARLSEQINFSVDYLDGDHLLVTFNPKRLFTRLPECPPTHNDRRVHAAIVEISTRKVVVETDWYLHDSARYVWPLGAGRFLLRRLNRLYIVDSDFSEKLALDSPHDLVWVSVTPDGQQIIAETVEKGSAKESKDKAGGHVKLAFIETRTLEVQRVIPARNVIRLDATELGFADARIGSDAWLVRFGASLKERHHITRVRARATPNLLYSTRNSMLVGRCSMDGKHYNLSSFTTGGRFLWRERRDGCRYRPSARRSEGGSRFILSTMIPKVRPSETDTTEELTDDKEGLDQEVEVLESGSGSLVHSVRPNPAVIDAENVALSPDARQLAVLAEASIVLYPLPESTAEEKTKYSELRTAPDLPVEPSDAADAADDDAAELASQPAAQNPPPGAEKKPEPAPAAPPATSSEPEQQPTITIRASTQVVAVDVVVSDSQHHPIKGLPQEEFSISENGTAQALSYFREYRDTLSADQPAAPAQRPTLPPNVYSNVTQPNGSASTVIVLLDMLNTPMADQSRMHSELIKFMKSKPRDLQFAVFTLSNRLQMVQGFTKDGDLLVAAAGKEPSKRYRPLITSDTMLQPAIDAANDAARMLARQGTQAMNASGVGFMVDSLKALQAESHAVEEDRRVTLTINAFAQLARSLSGIPGRKNMVWLSGSFPLAITPDPTLRSPFTNQRDYSENLRKVANLLAEAHVSVYPVSIKGLTGDSVFDAVDKPSMSSSPSPSSSPVGTGNAPPIASSREGTDPMANLNEVRTRATHNEGDELSSMDALAKSTGGMAFYRTNGIAQAMAAATEHGANYYALSYKPVDKNYDGSFRNIKVTLKKAGYHLAYRSGYYAIDPLTAPAQASNNLNDSLALAAMQAGSPESRQIVFASRVVPVGKPHDAKNEASKTSAKRKPRGPMQRYSIDYVVSPGDLRFRNGSDGKFHDTLNFLVAASNSDGNMVASQVSQVAADFGPSGYKALFSRGLSVHQEAEVPVASSVIRLGVEDLANGHVGTVEIPLPVPIPPEAPDAVQKVRSLPPIEPD